MQLPAVRINLPTVIVLPLPLPTAATHISQYPMELLLAPLLPTMIIVDWDPIFLGRPHPQDYFILMWVIAVRHSAGQSQQEPLGIVQQIVQVPPLPQQA
jgi:hypothetical protein